jgi:hypothetical protein
VTAYLAPVDADVLCAIAPALKTRLSRAGSVPGTAGAVDVLYVHDGLADKEFDDVVRSDLKWAVLSFVSVFGYIVYHTRSFMLATIGMFISGISYPVALLIYRGAFGVRASHGVWICTCVCMCTGILAACNACTGLAAEPGMQSACCCAYAVAVSAFKTTVRHAGGMLLQLEHTRLFHHAWLRCR